MDIISILLIFSLIAFLFSMYVLSNDDITLMRKNISLEHVFNISIIVFLISIFFSRLFYTAFHFTKGYLNPLVFFVVPYFPGLSLAGGVLGGLLCVAFTYQNRKLPTGRLFDFFSISFLFSISLSSLVYFSILIVQKKAMLISLIIPVIYFLLFLVLAKGFLPLQKRGELKDGTLGFMFLSSFSVISFLISLFKEKTRLIGFLSGEDLLLVLLLVIGISLMIKQERLLGKFRKSR